MDRTVGERAMQDKGDRADALQRRALVGSFMPFVVRCTRGHAVLERVAAGHQLAAHQLGLLNSAYLAVGRAPVSERALRDAVPYAARSRLGAEHWQPMIAVGFARELADGWVMTEAGLDVVAELYREVWREVASRTVDPALVGRIGVILERHSYTVLLTSRARFIRELWVEAPTTPLVRLYRAVWELSIYRDACFRAAWQTEGYTGPLIDVLTQVWEGASTAEAITERLAAKQERESIVANLVLLEERDDIERSADAVALTTQGRATRDAIEGRTDTAYFDRWPVGVRLQALKVDFDALMRAVE